MSSVVIRGWYIAKTTEMFHGVYEIRGLDPNVVSYDEAVISASRRELSDLIRKYTQDKFKTPMIKPYVTDKLIRESLHNLKVEIQYDVVFESKQELNRYKLSHPHEYAEMKK